MMCGGARITNILEPSSNLMITASIVKRLTGNEEISSRELFAKGKETKAFIPMFTLIASCNEVPKFDNFDNAVARRILIVEFETTFSDDCPSNSKERITNRKFPIKEDVEEIIDRTAPALAYRLVQVWKEYGRKKIVMPQKVQRLTKKYIDDSNYVKRFLAEIDEVLSDQELFEC